MLWRSMGCGVRSSCIVGAEERKEERMEDEVGESGGC